MKASLTVPLHCSITKFYMQGACINNRDNDFFSTPNCGSGGAVTDGSAATCHKVFASSALSHTSVSKL